MKRSFTRKYVNLYIKKKEYNRYVETSFTFTSFIFSSREFAINAIIPIINRFHDFFLFIQYIYKSIQYIYINLSDVKKDKSLAK